MKVEELTKGIVSVSELSAGDIIRGLREPEKTQDWCRVDAVYLRETISKNFATYNGFTEDHMVIDGDIVHPHGKKVKQLIHNCTHLPQNVMLLSMPLVKHLHQLVQHFVLMN